MANSICRWQTHRVLRCKELLKRAANDAHRQFVFCDEKLFSVEANFNRQNRKKTHWKLLKCKHSGWLIAKKAHSASAMVCAFITSEGKAPSVYVNPGMNMNQYNYMDKALRKLPFSFSQDSSLATYSGSYLCQQRNHISCTRRRSEQFLLAPSSWMKINRGVCHQSQDFVEFHPICVLSSNDY